MVAKIKDFFWHPVTFYISVILIFFGVIGVINATLGFIDCKSYGNMTERVTKYSIVSGCYVKTNAGMIPKSELNKRVIANGVE